MKIIFVILAAGKGRRFGQKNNKLFFKVNNRPLIFYLLKKAEGFKQINEIVLVTNRKDIPRSKKIIRENNFQKVISIIEGGKRRQDSVFLALQWIKKRIKARQPLYIGIHDGARLNISEKLIKKLIINLKNYDAVIPGQPVTDTIKSVKHTLVQRTILRENLVKVSTPQFFKFDTLYDSYLKAVKDDCRTTDDAGIVEHIGGKVKIVEDELQNIKLTYRDDLKYMLYENHKIGLGFDVHKLVRHRKLILGGIKIEHEFGLEGYSDADVLIHAVIDALLGAAGLGDIGEHFPDTNKKYQNIDSTILLKKTLQMVIAEYYQIINIDTTIFAQNPKLVSYKEKIRNNLSRLLQIDPRAINIKAKTMEQMGFIGREEGIAAQAVVLLKKIELR